VSLRRLATVCGALWALLGACGGDGRASADPRDSPAGPPAASAAATWRVPSDAGRLRVDAFDAGRAWRLLVEQVEVGPRPTGSDALRALGDRLVGRLPHGRIETEQGGIRNLVGRIPGSKPAVLVAAHYDTKDLPGFVGAEDGAGGTAAVIEIARVMSRVERPAGAPELRFVLFDGEECPDDARDFYSCGLRGSRPYAAEHADELKAVVVLDFIAQKDLVLRRDASADKRLWRRLRAAARRAGTISHFPSGPQGTILDDHTPFLRAGLPAIDLIDFDFPCWHKPCDDLSAVSPRSLDRSGETVVELLRRLR
jgi:glutaminyl-peptide cyclotransferase